MTNEENYFVLMFKNSGSVLQLDL